MSLFICITSVVICGSIGGLVGAVIYLAIERLWMN